MFVASVPATLSTAVDPAVTVWLFGCAVMSSALGTFCEEDEQPAPAPTRIALRAQRAKRRAHVSIDMSFVPCLAIDPRALCAFRRWKTREAGKNAIAKSMDFIGRNPLCHYAVARFRKKISAIAIRRAAGFSQLASDYTDIARFDAESKVCALLLKQMHEISAPHDRRRRDLHHQLRARHAIRNIGRHSTGDERTAVGRCAGKSLVGRQALLRNARRCPGLDIGSRTR
jgi:hypothetical protein